MDPITISAILKGIGIALNVHKTVSHFSNTGVDKELKDAFEKALKSWAPNKTARDKRRSVILQSIQKLNTPALHKEVNNEKELSDFIPIYEKELASHHSASNYISNLKADFRHQEVVKLVEKGHSNDGARLEEEWIDRVEAYKSSINSFKPKTALELLLKLEDRCQTQDIKPSNSLLGSIEFLKAQCYQMMNSAQDMYKSSITAFQKNSKSFSIMERACYSFAKTNEIEQAIILAQNILDVDEFNPTAFAVKALVSKEKNLEEFLCEVPTKVIQHIDFKRIIYFNTNQNPDYPNRIEIYEQYQLYPDDQYFDIESPITVENYKNWYFLIETSLFRLFRMTNYSSDRIEISDKELLNNTNTLLKRFTSSISDSEMKFANKELEFFKHYTDFAIHFEKETVTKMKFSFSKIEDYNPTIVLLLTHSLQLVGRFDEAISILNSQSKLDINLIQVKLYSQLKNQDFEDYLVTAREFLPLLQTIDAINCERILNIIYGLSLINKLHEIEEEQFIESKSFELEYFETLIKCFVKILKGETISEQVTSLQSIEKAVSKSKLIVQYYLPFSYYLAGEYDRAIACFEKYLSSEEPSRDFYYYILSLSKSNSNHVKLLSLLKKWRKEFSFNEQLLRIEANIAIQLTDWKKCFEISEYFLTNYPKDESFLTLELICLIELHSPKKEKRIKELSKIFENYDFKEYGHIQAVSKILVENGFPQIGLDLLYRSAVDKGNSQARMDYIFITTLIPKGIIREMETVEIDCYVKYILNEDTKFQRIKKSNGLAEKFLGKSKGDFITIARPITGEIDSIQITRIMDKYLCLHDEILEEVKNPYSELPMQSFNFPDASPEAMNDTFIKLFGAKGTLMKDEREVNFASYYNYDLSFTELIIRSYSSDYLGGYFNLITQKDGFTQVPLIYYPSDISFQGKEFVIDLASLFIIHKISQDCNYEFKTKFLIAHGNVEFLRKQLKKEKEQPKERLSLDITMDGVNPYIIPENAIQGNIEYLNKILTWIELNCLEIIVESKLDLLKNFEKEVDGIFGNIILENIALTKESDDRIFISDDSFYFKVFSVRGGKTISTEKYMSVLDLGDIEWQKSFVESKYVGFSMKLELIYDEFIKKVKSKPNVYDFCITNTTLRLIPNKQTIYTITKFLKKVALNPVVSDMLFAQEATRALVGLLKGQKKVEAFELTNSSIEKEFQYLGTKHDLALHSYYDALIILGRT